MRYGIGMNGYVSDIEQETRANTDFRRVIYTAHHLQLVLMCIPAGEEIGEEVHELDQFLRIESGEGVILLGEKEYPICDGIAIIVPAGTRHNVRNTGTLPLQLYTLYAPPEHRDGTVHSTKREAEREEEHFDGVTTQ